jgi:nicotinate phosphoribosyltransferase
MKEPASLEVDRNNALFLDLYELTMAASYYSGSATERGIKGVFEMFVRKLPRNRSYLVAAGLEQVIQYLMCLEFNDTQISYLRSADVFKNVNQDFFKYLKQFKFTGTVWAVPEGTIVFPYEPIVRIEAPIVESQIVETFILSMINFQSMISTKASRISIQAKGRPVFEFGSRRAHGPQAAVLAARASYIGGCHGTSNVLAGYQLGIPVHGTMAHSFIMAFEKEEEAFEKFIEVIPTGYLLVDTYDSIAAIQKIIKQKIHPNGIRLDSGDLSLFASKARRLLDRTGYEDCKIMASGDLNEYHIHHLIRKGAPIDSFGVGSELTTSRDDPVMSGVYKLVAVRIPNAQDTTHYKTFYTFKKSPRKVSYPGPKQIMRIIQDGLIKMDLLYLENEKDIPKGSIPVMKKYVDNGNIVTKLPTIQEIRKTHFQQQLLLPRNLRTLNVTSKTSLVSFSEKLQNMIRTFKAE